MILFCSSLNNLYTNEFAKLKADEETVKILEKEIPEDIKSLEELENLFVVIHDISPDLANCVLKEYIKTTKQIMELPHQHLNPFGKSTALTYHGTPHHQQCLINQMLLFINGFLMEGLTCVTTV